MSFWQSYQPSNTQPWDVKRVVHLHRRTVFGATWPEVQRDLTSDPQDAVTRLLTGTTRHRTPEGFANLSDAIGSAAADSPNPDRLKAWWLYRCLYSPDPLQERLTLMWHNHFATSNLKVNSLHLMKRQNDTLRQYARADFGDLLNAILRDPALLLWLDAPANRRGNPNENLAREVMELFTLGVSHYTEADVREAARALTGWSVRKGRFEQQSKMHDDGEKTLLQQTGRWNGADVARILVNHDATADRLAWRLIGEFFGEDVVSNEAHRELAAYLRRNSLNIAAAVELVLRSALFLGDANINTRVCDPVSFIIGPLRSLRCIHPPPGTLILAQWLRRMGQDLFYPPNVGGWNGGRSWLSTRTVIARSNYIVALTSGRLHNPVLRPELDRVLNESGDHRSRVDAASDLLGIRIDDDERTELEHQAATDKMISVLMTHPTAHLH